MAAGMTAIPASPAAIQRAMFRHPTLACAKRRIISTVDNARASAITISEVFNDTPNAAPRTAPRTRARRAVNGLPASTAIATSQSVVQRTSVRNSDVMSRKFGHKPAKITAHAPARREKSVAPIR